MTFDEIGQRVSQTLEDEGLTHFTAAELRASMQDGYALIALICETREALDDVTIPADSQYVDFSTYIPDLYRVWAIYNKTSRRWVLPATFQRIQSMSDRWESLRGNVRNFTPMGYGKILVFPSPSASQLLSVYTKKLVSEIDLAASPEFFSDCHIVIQHYCVSDLLDQNLEFTKSQKHFEMFQREVQELRDRYTERVRLATIKELACKSIATRT